MAWIAIGEFLYSLLTSLRFWIGLTIALSVIPAVWSYVSSMQRAPQTIVVGQPQQGVDISPIINMMMIMFVMMIPIMVMRMLVGREAT